MIYNQKKKIIITQPNIRLGNNYYFLKKALYMV
nr:MAG TPA: hypothetical protein [Caudoviricetes sp.]